MQDNGFFSRGAPRGHGGLQSLSRIVKRTIRLKLIWSCSEKQGFDLISSLGKSDQEFVPVTSVNSSEAGER
jgi:hypothetical protein